MELLRPENVNRRKLEEYARVNTVLLTKNEPSETTLRNLSNLLYLLFPARNIKLVSFFA